MRPKSVFLGSVCDVARAHRQNSGDPCTSSVFGTYRRCVCVQFQSPIGAHPAVSAPSSDIQNKYESTLYAYAYGNVRACTMWARVAGEAESSRGRGVGGISDQ